MSISTILDGGFSLTNNRNAQGIVLMVLSMAAFALTDTLVKQMSTIISPAQVLFFLIGGGLIVFTSIARFQGGTLLDPKAFVPVLLLRYLAEVIGMVGMVMALANAPISTVGAITQATPLLAAVGAVLFLGERVSWRRWSAIIVGFIGVLFIVQPGAAGFELTILWAVLALVAFSIRDLTTSMTPSHMSSATLATFTMIAAMPFVIGWVAFNGESFFPTGLNWITVLTMVGLGSFGYMLLIASLRMAEVSAVMPFRYTRIIFLLVVGIVVFEERPGVSTYFGATLIILSGLYMMWREQQIKRQAAASAKHESH
ncbi:MAG: EamA family transporter [Hyphomicrobiales bacterium]|nr:MAG: EamA family transporter [Hyphomicrobiales bacterium]